MLDNVIPFERSPEKTLNEREVLNLFEEIIGGNFEIVRSVEDEEGLSALDVMTVGEDGEKVEYDYRRKDNAGETVIDVVFYMGDVPCGGHSLKKCQAGVWVSDV